MDNNSQYSSQQGGYQNFQKEDYNDSEYDQSVQETPPRQNQQSSPQKPQQQQQRPGQQQQRPAQNNNNSRPQQQQQQQQQSRPVSQQKAVYKPGEPLKINVACKYKDHEDAIMGICFKPICEKQSRLVCFTCAISNHHDHAQYIVRLSDMEKTDDLFLRNWPSNEQAIKINDFLKFNQPEKTEHLIDERFDNFEKAFKVRIDKCRQKVKDDLHDKLKRNSNIVKELDKKMDDTYNLVGIKGNIQELNEEKITLEQFEKRTQEFLTGKNTQMYQIELDNLFIEKKKKIHDSFNMDLLQHFFDKSLKLIEDLPQLMWPKSATVKIDNKGNVGGITSGLHTTTYKKM